jgi:hypothetical protein
MTFRKDEDTGNWKRGTRSQSMENLLGRGYRPGMTDYKMMMMKKL